MKVITWHTRTLGEVAARVSGLAIVYVEGVTPARHWDDLINDKGIGVNLAIIKKVRRIIINRLAAQCTG